MGRHKVNREWFEKFSVTVSTLKEYELWMEVAGMWRTEMRSNI